MKRLVLLLLSSLACAHQSTTGLLTLAEKTEQGDLLQYPTAASVVDADLNSAIRIMPSERMLRTFSLPRTSDPGLVARMKALAVLQEKLNRSIEHLRSAAQLARTVRAGDGKATSEQLHAFLAAHAEYADVDDAIKSYAGEIGRSPELEARIEEFGDSPELMLSWVAERYSALDEELSRKAAHDRSLEVTAWIGRPAAQVHIPGYDDLSAGAAHEVEKMHFAPVAPEEMEQARKLSAAAQSWNSFKDAARTSLEAEGTRIVARITEFKEKVAGLAQAMAQAPAPAPDGAKGALETANKTCTRAVEALDVVRASIQSPSDDDPALALNQLIGSLRQASSKVSGCGKALNAAREALASLTAPAPGAAVAEPLKKLVDAVAVSLGPLLAATGDSDVANVPQLSTLAVPLASARPADLPLLGVERGEGDIVTIRARILEPNGKMMPGGEDLRYVRLRARPFVADTGALVLWVRGIRHHTGTFLPGAGAYAVVRFTGWRDDGDAGSPIAHLLAPGLGLAAVAVPQASDGSNKLAWMGMFQLFGDVLQLGVGLTLDASPVWGFGVGLHRLAGVGKFLQ